MKMRLILPALLTAACLCACTPAAPGNGSGSVISSGSVSGSQSQTDVSQEKTTYTEADVQAAFQASDRAKNASILDCVVAEDQAYELMGVVQYLSSDQPDFCMVAFVALDGTVYASGPQAQPAYDNSLTYLGDGAVSFQILTDASEQSQLYQLTFHKDGTKVTFTAVDNEGGETELIPEA